MKSIRPMLRLVATVLAASITLGSCGGTVLHTLEADAPLPEPNIYTELGPRLSAVLYMGNITVDADLPAGSKRIEASSVMMSRPFVWDFMEGAADPDTINLVITVGADTISVDSGSSAESVNLDFDLTIHVPSDYPFNGGSFYSGGGSILASGLRGRGLFEFKSYADALDGNYSVEVDEVEGDIWVENSQGDITISDSGPILYAVCYRTIDAEILAYPHGYSPRIEAGDGINLRVSPSLDFGFLTPASEESSLVLEDPAFNTRVVVAPGGQEYIDVYLGTVMADWHDFAYMVSTLRGKVRYFLAD